IDNIDHRLINMFLLHTKNDSDKYVDIKNFRDITVRYYIFILPKSNSILKHPTGMFLLQPLYPFLLVCSFSCCVC
ncbi:hypothetical protein L9F63_000024, partial [Diploptera punctata]